MQGRCKVLPSTHGNQEGLVVVSPGTTARDSNVCRVCHNLLMQLP